MQIAKHFSSANAYWKFSETVRFQARFIHGPEVLEFLAAVEASAQSRILEFPKEKPLLWRAQLGHNTGEREQDGIQYSEPVPFEKARMKPLRRTAHEGRINPRGIPCLYAASDEETAVAEVRPWLDALVSVAQLQSTESLKLVDCSKGHDSFWKDNFFLPEPAPEVREEKVWNAIGRAFSEPVSPDLDAAEYAPTQVLAEHFKKLGYDGVIYKSNLSSDGVNFAIFDSDLIDVANVRLYSVKVVRCEIGEVAAG